MRNRNWLIVIVGLILLCCVLVVIGVLVSEFTRRDRLAAVPTVQIFTPRQGDTVTVGSSVVVFAKATAPSPVMLLRLSVDGQLVGEMSGAAPTLSAAWDWTPSAAGDHTLLVQAFNKTMANGAATTRVRAVENPNTDRDGDGIPDNRDNCPNQFGTSENQGCPQVRAQDRDGDGILDAQDRCPDQPGAIANQGCPAASASDQDGDGVLDSQDNCPTQAGSADNQGCPAGASDRDGDGVLDAQDNCPDQPGPASNRGCPVTSGDRDSDGVPDARDNCPDQAGPADNQGCPRTGSSDRDGDGIEDTRDLCPDQPGPASNQGCPLPSDRDGDGLLDAVDDCPDQAGPVANRGCPVIESGDRDGDGVADASDGCPDDPGPAPDGCPVASSDRDGDGIPDTSDACPDRWGVGWRDGCPAGWVIPRPIPRLPLCALIPILCATGDRDGDGVPDDRDRCPDEAGVVIWEGCPRPPWPIPIPEPSPLPGGICERLPGLCAPGGGRLFDDVELESITGQVEIRLEQLQTESRWSRLFCYLQLHTLPLMRLPDGGYMISDGRGTWDLTDPRSARLTLDRELLHIEMSCYGGTSDPAAFPQGLGILVRDHDAADVTGAPITARAEGGGHWFQVTYRICRDHCE
jgi:hypothetical protein